MAALWPLRRLFGGKVLAVMGISHTEAMGAALMRVWAGWRWWALTPKQGIRVLRAWRGALGQSILSWTRLSKIQQREKVPEL